MGLPRKFNTWRKHGGVWKRLVHSWLPRLSRNLGAATGVVTLWWHAYLPISARTVNTILPVWPMFPTRCGTDGFFHFSICCSNRLGWYWGWQRTSWIRKTVTVFCCRKNFVREIFAVTDNRENFLTAKISPIYGNVELTHYMVNRGPRTAFEHDRWHGLYSFCWGAQELWIGDHSSNYCTVA